MVVFLLIAVLAFLYFKGQAQMAATQQAAQNAQSNTAANSAGAQQGTSNQNTYDSVLAAINEGLKFANKVADTQVQKH